MEMFQLTRKEMADLLLSLQGENNLSPVAVLKEAWFKRHPDKNEATNASMATQLPAIFEKLIKAGKKGITLSLNDIVSLGNQIEHTTFSLAAVQNWVKRDAKDIIGSPENGRKYSLDQAAILFIVDDLKTVLDFASIRQLLKMLFNDPEDRKDDLIFPLDFYRAYASIFEDLDPDGDQMIEAEEVDPSLALIKKEKTLEALIEKRAKQYVDQLPLTDKQKQLLSNVLVVSILTIQVSFLESLARRYTSTTLFLLNQ
jgi:hypothetical protein